MTQDTAQGAREALAADCAARVARLTFKQREALVLAAKGFSTPEAARWLGVAPNTQQSHRRDLLARLEVDSMIEAAVLAAKAGLV